MTAHFSLQGLAALGAGALLAACTATTPAPGTGSGSGADAQLALQASAMQRTVLEATVTGAVLGGGGGALFGGDREDILRGLLIGAAAGAAAGTYVGYLQSQYASDEARLERLRADIDRTNAETEAAVRNMRAVLAQDRQRLAVARAAGPSGDLPAAEAAAERDLGNMRAIIAGAERRQAEFMSTRSLQLAPGQTTGVDRQIADLGQRIAEMRAIATSLEQDL